MPVRRGAKLIPVEGDGVMWMMRADLVDELLPACRQAISGAAASAVAQTVKTGPHRTVYRLSLAGGEFYLKHFRVADRKALLQNLVRPSKAEREWRAAQTLARLGLPTFEPVALGRLRRGGLVYDSFLVSREIPETVPLDQLVTAELASGAGSPQSREAAHRQSDLRHRLAVAMGELAARLHRAGVEHADLHAGNVLVRVSGDDLPALWPIDLDKVRLHRGLSSRRRFENLAFLHQFFAGKSTRSDRLRFYCAYRQEWGRGAPPGDIAAAMPSARAEIAAFERLLSVAAHRGWVRA
ncbi:MAG: lipopolysaccharide kinase InaA family protein, partial [Deltaproteobacteria bacterium]